MSKRWNEESLQLEALKYKTRIEFKTKKTGAYRAAISLGIMDNICTHMVSGRLVWSKDLVKTVALKHASRWEFQKKDKGAYLFAFNSGILNEVCEHMVLLNKASYTTEDILAEAKKYNSRIEFKTNNQYVYAYARRLGILKEATSHMAYISRPPYSNDELQAESLKYKTRSEFRRVNNPMYNASVRRKILDSICSHMANSCMNSFEETNVHNLVKQSFPKAQSLKDRKVSIPGKPHIKGFDIDIYIPELRKGIEFDGQYWHSVPGLKRSREHWPEEDLSNYHDIKDKHFKTKGIEILHISDKDWSTNREECVEKISNFLSIKFNKAS